MKKVITIMLAVFIMLSHVACGESTDVEPTDSPIVTPDVKVLEWPNHEYAALIPVPESTVGEVLWEYDDEIYISVEETNKEAYAAYVSACAEVGFSENVSQDTNCYYAMNSDQYRLSLEHDEYLNIMTILIEEPIYNVIVEVDCEANLLFNRYNVTVVIDYIEMETLEHGSEGTYELELEAGTYEIVFHEEDDDSVCGTVEFTVSNNTALKYEIACKADLIEIIAVDDLTPPVTCDDLGTLTYDEIKELFYSAGFTSIEKKEIKDLPAENKDSAYIVTNIIIEDRSDFTTADTFFKDTKIVIEYHTQMDIAITMDEDDFLGMNYTEAEQILRNMGFNTFEYEVLETEDQTKPDGTVGAVEIKSWTFGKGDFSKGDTYAPDAIVVLWYYECEEIIVVPNLTVENCPDLAELLKLRDPADPSVAAFSAKYRGQVIEFDACVHAIQNHGDYNTRYDILLGAGDFDPNIMRGPAFRLTDVSYFDMDLDTTLYYGDNVHIIAEVDEYDPNRQIFELDVIKVETR